MRVIDILHSPWAIRPDRLIEISEIYSRHLRGEKISKETIGLIEAQIGKPLLNEPKGYEVRDGIAVIPVQGVLAKRMNLFMQISGGTSTELLNRSIAEAVADPSVRGIVLDIDSPGGTVDGTQEAANAIYAASGSKPIAAFCNGMMASAAYWIGSAAQAGVYISGDTVDVGSIGVVTSHVDYSKAYDMRGIKVTELTAGKYKRIASEYEPLSESGRAYIQEQLDHLYGVFLSDVGRNRGGMSADQVHDRMADGRIFIGTKAIEAGLADGVMSMDDVMEMMRTGKKPERKKSAVVSYDKKIYTVDAESGAVIPAPDDKTAQAVTGAEKEKTMDIKELQEKHADLYRAVLAEGKAAGIEEGKAAELARVKSVKAVAMPGHEAAIEGFMFDGKTTGEQAAVAIVTAENAKRQAKAEAIKADGEELKVAASIGDEGKAVEAMKRSDFNKLSPQAQASHIQAGVKVID